MKKLAVLLFSMGFYLPQAVAADSAVILMYHRFGEAQFPSTNIRLEQLDAHIKELKRGPNTVLPVAQIISADIAACSESSLPAVVMTTNINYNHGHNLNS